ncbi:bifunctional adenosylcobinamide kinase/adenosylcobinamide-phosphate guanylyltransferase [Alkalihalobacterium bogoriense]|uniref:bifunctional adenosylcobinamide kinase/adenosylcobinamide-phosphate guanylyltransferase n=1 Tax=Alkalihalobacterium bogoriense TaxID=246272 RepID=UPI00047E08B2|nr:bifunctional adenosylcobinamide kinase/adenosylcobinamide-phosphate guanylyltransferase [Alkalihalobacterium bogoriense]
MHFITGGAFNGKSKWAKKHYQLTKRKDVYWYNGYEQIFFSTIVLPDHGVVIVNGVEYVIRSCIQSTTRQQLQEELKRWKAWEELEKSRKFIIIGSDVGKGVVPIEAENRKWRDYVGWFYQDLVNVCDRVDVIWYGLSQTIKS